MLLCLDNSVPTPIVASNSEYNLINRNPNVNLSMQFLEVAPSLLSHGLSNRGVEIDVLQLNSRLLENTIVCSGQRFSNVSAFQDALYLMSLGGRFQYYFKRNAYRHMTVVCTINGCLIRATVG